ncbi:MAG: AAC(3) family N-acetyltransferase [Clostridia bacterium]|nr:AAC(3) family N-acetyltransferase [Clostridia bacterium]
MGIEPNDTILIHTSMKAIGEVEGGADGLIDAFGEYLKDGLFIVPTHTWGCVGRDQPVYDVRSTVPNIGALPRCAAFRKDGIRSLHPTHSIWAKGKNACEFVKGEGDLESPAPRKGAWNRLADVHAKILLIGVSHNKNTFIHSIDEYASVPDRLGKVPYDVTVIDCEGNASTHPMHPHFCSKTGDISEYYVNFEKPLIRLGAQTMGKIGNAEVRVVDAYRCREIISRIYSRTKEDIFTGFTEIPEEMYI